MGSAPKPVPPRPPSSVGRLVSSGSLDLGAFPPGAMLGERYRIVGLLGRGGMGEVYRADDLKLGQAVALKFLPKAVSGDEALLARFHAEVRLARQVSHPNVCRIYDIGEIEGRHFLSMEYVDGEDLASLLKRIGHLPVDKAVDIARQLCAGLARRAREGRPPPRPQARERHARRPRARADHGLRPRRRRRGGRERRRGLRHARLHGARAARGQARVREERPLRARPRPLRGRDGQARVRRADARRDAPQARAGDAHGAVERPRGLRPGRRARDPALPREGPARAAVVGRAGRGRAARRRSARRRPRRRRDALARDGRRGGSRGRDPDGARRRAPRRRSSSSLGAIFVLSRWATDLGLSPLPKPPDVLEERAREIARRLGWTDPPADSAGWFVRDYAYLKSLARSARPGWARGLAAGWWKPAYFEYRQSPRPLIPANGEASRPVGPAARRDGNGHRRRRSRGPPALVRRGPTAGGRRPAPQPPSPPDWSTRFRRGRPRPEDLRSPPSPSGFRAFPSTRSRGFSGPMPGRRSHAERRRGLVPGPDRLLRAWSRRGASRRATPRGPLPLRAKVATSVPLHDVLIVGAVAAWFARRNVRLGRGDRRGAARIGIAVFLAVSAIRGSHASSGRAREPGSDRALDADPLRCRRASAVSRGSSISPSSRTSGGDTRTSSCPGPASSAAASAIPSSAATSSAALLLGCAVVPHLRRRERGARLRRVRAARRRSPSTRRHSPASGRRRRGRGRHVSSTRS